MCLCTVTKVMRDGGRLAEKGGAAIFFFIIDRCRGAGGIFFYPDSKRGAAEMFFSGPPIT